MTVTARNASMPWTRSLYCVVLLGGLGVALAGEAPRQQVQAQTVQYAVPAVRLIRNDGKLVSLRDEMNDGRPVLLNFIFTSCGSTCPLMSQVFAQFQRKMGADVNKV